MSDDLDDMLGIDPSDPLAAHARRLAEADSKLMAGLAAARRAEGLTVTELAERLGWQPGTVRAFERADADPAMSSVRRYALAVGVDIRHVLNFSR